VVNHPQRYKVGLVLRPGVKEALPYLAKVSKWCSEHSFELLFDAGCHKNDVDKLNLGLFSNVSSAEMVAQADIIVSLGGDGTFIGVARLITGFSPAMLGVNFGKLGFLTEIAPSELISVLDAVINNNAVIGERSMLTATVLRGGDVVATSQALNEVGIMKGVKSTIPNFTIDVSGQMVMAFRGDGVLIATPTGSTAYSLSAGGSIVHPDLDVVIVTPLCPHSLTVRPIVLPAKEQINVNLNDYDDKAYAVIDGHMLLTLEHGDIISVSPSPYSVRLVRSPSLSYFAILREKLNWGLANRERPIPS
jgi:NAD+ kinase